MTVDRPASVPVGAVVCDGLLLWTREEDHWLSQGGFSTRNPDHTRALDALYYCRRDALEEVAKKCETMSCVARLPGDEKAEGRRIGLIDAVVMIRKLKQRP